MGENEEKENGGSLLEEINSLISDVNSPEGGEAVVESEEGAEGETTAEEEVTEDASTGDQRQKSPKEETEDEEESESLLEETDIVAEAVDEGDRGTSEVDEVAELRAQIKRQQETIDELSSKITAPKEEPTVEETTEALDEFNLTEDEFEEIRNDPAAFVKFFRERENKLRRIIREEASTNTVKSLPTIVMRQVQYAANLNKAVNEFWEKNQDLMPVRKTVGVVTQDVIAEHPDYTIDKVFDEAGKRVRQMLGMKGKVQTNQKKKVITPAFAKTKAGGDRGGKQQPENKTIADEIDSFIH